MIQVPQALHDEWNALTSSIVELIPEEEFLERLQRARNNRTPLRIKYGVDPSAPDLHLGHTVPIRKLKQFQDFGHQVIFLIGDFTARIGDPTGKSETRKRLSKKEVDANARTYLEQIFKLLDEDKTEVVYNSTWLEKMSFSDVIELSSKYTMARMLEREDYKRRFKDEKPIYIHEFLYPLMQGYDSIVLRSDVEIGGTDQKFNILVARELQREFGQPPQIILTLPILIGTDGLNKMSKSLNNYIGITEPPQEIFGKVMSIPDSLMGDYLELTLGYSSEEVAGLMRSVEQGKFHPRDLKARLARELVATYHSHTAANAAEEEFNRIFREHDVPTDIQEITMRCEDGKLWIVKLLVESGLAKSNREARKLITAGAVWLNAEKITDQNYEVSTGQHVLKVGKRRFLRVTLA
jgi:tyrosyl-tRNA synthetase